jgi:hypothetical protein
MLTTSSKNSVIKLSDLPMVIFSVIKDFLIHLSVIDNDRQSYRENSISWRNLLNCNKNSFYEIKQYYGYYNLNTESSLQYLLHQRIPFFHNFQLMSLSNSLFLNFKKTSILNYLLPSIHLKYHGMIASTLFELIYNITCNLTYYECSTPILFSKDDLLLLSTINIRVLKISVLRLVEDSLLTLNSNIHELDISLTSSSHHHQQGFSEKIIIPRNIQKLSLCNCTGKFQLISFNSFQNLYYLNLSHCIHLSDVSMLTNVKHLILDYCFNILDISMLSNIPILSVRGILIKVQKGLLLNNNVKSLTISDEAIPIILSYQQKQKKELMIYCRAGTILPNTIEGYTKIKFLTLSIFDGFFHNFYSLQSLSVISLRKIKEKKDHLKFNFSSLPNLIELSLTNIKDYNLVIKGGEPATVTATTTTTTTSKLKRIFLEKCCFDVIEVWCDHLEEFQIIQPTNAKHQQCFVRIFGKIQRYCINEEICLIEFYDKQSRRRKSI